MNLIFPTVSQAFIRGQKIAEDQELSLIDKTNYKRSPRLLKISTNLISKNDEKNWDQSL
jgi:hypothetical protein